MLCLNICFKNVFFLYGPEKGRWVSLLSIVGDKCVEGLVGYFSPRVLPQVFRYCLKEARYLEKTFMKEKLFMLKP